MNSIRARCASRSARRRAAAGSPTPFASWIEFESGHRVEPSRTLTLTPIGVVRSPLRDKRSAPRQPAPGSGLSGTIELLQSGEYRDALLDLERWSHIWVLFWFDRSVGSKP